MLLVVLVSFGEFLGSVLICVLSWFTWGWLWFAFCCGVGII